MTVLVWRVCCWEPAEEHLFTCDFLILKQNTLMKTEATLIHHMNADELIKLFVNLQNQIGELKLHYEPKKPTELLTLKCNIKFVHTINEKKRILLQSIL
jgi:hypothetical protein